MGLLDEQNYEPRYTPNKKKGKKYQKQTALSQESRDKELNNLGLEENAEDYSDSPFADRE